MKRNQRPPTMILAICLTVAVALPAAAGGQPQLGARPRVAPTYGTRSSARHLYAVAYPGQIAIDRFPLAADGLPATQPDGVLYPQGLSDIVGGFGVDGQGNMFLVDVNAQAVDEFAAGATGSQPPIRTLNLRGAEPDYVRADREGRLYVHYASTGGIGVFAKGAHGNDKAISYLPTLGNLTGDYLISSTGVVYVVYFAKAVAVYLHPLDNPSGPDAMLVAQRGREFDFWILLTLDEQTSRLYIQFFPRGIGGYGQNDWAARYTWDLGGVALDKWILNNRCYNASQSWISGAAIAGNYLAMTCSLDGDAFIFRTDAFGRQQPVEIVGQGDALDYLLAIGP